MAAAVLLQGHLPVELLIDIGPGPPAEHPAPAAYEGLVQDLIQAAAFLLDDLAVPDDDDAALLAPVLRVAVRPAEVGVFAHDNLGGLGVVILDEVHLAVLQGVQALGLTGAEEQGHLLLGDVAVAPGAILDDGLGIQFNRDAGDGLILHLAELFGHFHDLLTLIFTISL